MTAGTGSAPDVEGRIESFQANFRRLRDEIGNEVVGYTDVVERVLVCLFAGGHVLLEGVPGLGKTLLVRTLAKRVLSSIEGDVVSPEGSEQ